MNHEIRWNQKLSTGEVLVCYTVWSSMNSNPTAK
jgi:hypothetical protein